MAFNYERLKQTVCIGISLVLALLLFGCGAHVFHQVRKNDTLYSISWHYNQDYRQVAKWNGLAPPYTITEGQWLRVAPPGPEAGLAPPVYSKQAKEASRPQAGTSQPSRPKPVPKATVPKAVEPKERPASVSNVAWHWPVKGKVIQGFSSNKPGAQGIDIAANQGTLVNAAAAGKVVYSGNGLRGYGNLIIIKHNEKFLSAYAHNQSILVKEGAMVKQGDAIARMGKTESNRVKLHFQIRINGKPVDPMRYLPK